MTESKLLPDDLPCPTPLPSAVERDVFGIMEDGDLVPDPIEVRSMTEEYARTMVVLLADVTHLEWCNQHGLDPKTDRPLNLKRQGIVSGRLRADIERLTQL